MQVQNTEPELNIIDYIENGDLKMVKKLIDSGIDLNYRPKPMYNYNLLTSSVYSKQYSIFDFLIKQGADINNNNNIHGYTPFIMAVAIKDDYTTDKLLSLNVDINCETNMGATPLMFAAQHQNIEMIDILLAKGADASIKNKNGKTFIEECIKTSTDHLATYNVQDFLLSKFPILYNNIKNKNVMLNSIKEKYIHLENIIDLNLL